MESEGNSLFLSKTSRGDSRRFLPILSYSHNLLDPQELNQRRKPNFMISQNLFNLSSGGQRPKRYHLIFFPKRYLRKSSNLNSRMCINLTCQRNLKLRKYSSPKSDLILSRRNKSSSTMQKDSLPSIKPRWYPPRCQTSIGYLISSPLSLRLWHCSSPLLSMVGSSKIGSQNVLAKA